MTKHVKFILAIFLQVMIIVTIIIFKLSILTSGTDVMLKIAPVDPRDLLRGDYVTFRYDISNLGSYISKRDVVRNGDTIYVTLQHDGKYYLATSFQKDKPTDGEIFIKGTVASGGLDAQASSLQRQDFRNSNVGVVYGIEEYFIPEGKGQGFSFFNKESAARVAIDQNGNAVLKQIYVQDKPWP